MALTPIIAAGDGVRVTVSDLVKQPRVIPKRLLNLMDNQFLADTILRNGGSAESGVVRFDQSTPLFADNGSSIRSEFGEYQIVQTSDGTPMVVTTVDRGLALRISKEMRSRNQMDRLNQQMTQIKNTLVRDWDLAFQSAVLNAVTTIIDVSATRPWASRGVATIRNDVETAILQVQNAVTGNQANNFLAFNPDSIIMGTQAKFDIVTDPNFLAPYRGNMASENPTFNGTLPQQICNLDPFVSRVWPQNMVLVCERKTIGFINDEEPLQSSPLYWEQKTKSWCCDTNRTSAIGIDQPLAGVVIKIA
jgi:hypothetical protein